MSIPLRPFTPVETKCPILAVHSDKKTTITKGLKLARVIELLGKDYSGLDDDTLDMLYLARKRFFDHAPENMTLFQQSHRMKVSRALASESYVYPLAGEIGELWAAQFTTSYRSRHYVIAATAEDNIVDQLALLGRKGEEGEGENVEQYRQLVDYSNDIVSALAPFSPRIISDNDVPSYWATLLNGRHVQAKASENGLLDGVLAGAHLQWPRRKEYQIYDGAEKVYSAWLIIKLPAQASDPGLMDALFRVNHEISVYQTFSKINKVTALAEVEDRLKNVVSFLSNADIIYLELNELLQRIQADEISLMRHRFAVEVFGESVSQLEDAVRAVRQAIVAWGYTVGREKRNQEALFWSRFPELQNYNSRVRPITSENAAHYATFTTVGEGLDSCSWGDMPVTTFKTTTGSEYAFTFHETSDRYALGHTLAIGGSNSGKTTLISFLLSQCFKFQGFRALCLDRLHGLEVFTKLHGGSYQDFVAGVKVNPLHLDNTPDNHVFLQTWFQMITGKSDDLNLELINDAIKQLYTLDKKERRLQEMAVAFGQKSNDSARLALERWLPGNSFGSFFTGDYDAMDFKSPLVSFDMTTLLDIPEVVGPMAYYMFHKLFHAGRQKGGYACFVDELPKYLKSEVFAPYIEVILQELRKTDGVGIFAAQSADKVLDSKYSETFLNNIATYLLFPEPKADRKHYVGQLGLTEQEFDWIKTGQHRHCMVKRKGGESVIVNVDLKSLGKYLRVFDSGSDSIRLLNEMEGVGGDWKKDYINSIPGR